jgi:ring-1,2-phenylacetyl-CoA epoxidase subunit PaaE
MAVHFHSLQVKSIRKETDDCVSVLLDVPEQLMPVFSFTQGQSLTLRSNINGQEARRTYSICSSPLDKELRVAIKKVPGGLFSSYANEDLQVGDVLEVMEPVGKFNTPLHPTHKKNYLALAAGSGITPILSIIKTTLQIEPSSSFTLAFGNKTRGSIIFFEELEGIKNKYLDRFQLIHILSREKTDAEINYGRIDAEKLKNLSALIDYANMDEFFICGPEEMIFATKDFFEANGIDGKKIHFELFGSKGVRKTTMTATKEAESANKSSVTIKLDGRSFDFALGYHESNILDAALKQGADLPFACKGGVCCTCKAKIIRGCC